MKKLFFALICTAIGFSASASDLSPKKPTNETKIERASLNTIRVETENSAIAKSSLFRRQMNFTFTDACGESWTVYVSGPSSESNYSLYLTAWSHFVEHTISVDNRTGCYQP